jgi:hypothetical protein
MLYWLFWFSVAYMYILGLITETIKGWFYQKEEHYKRLEKSDVGNELLAKRILQDKVM